MEDIFNHPYTWKSDLPAVPAKLDAPVSIVTERGNITMNPTSDSKMHVTVHKLANELPRRKPKRARIKSR